MELPRGHFFGTVEAKEIGGFLLSLIQADRGASFPWHWHREPALTFVVAGRFSERLRTGLRHYSQGMMILRPAGQCHAEQLDTAATCLNVNFDGAWLERINSHAIGSSTVLATPAATAIGARITQEFQRADSHSAMVLEGLLLEFSGQLLRARAVEPSPAWLRKAYQIISERFTQPLSLRPLALEVGVHPAHLARAFRTEYGQTVGELIRHLRVERVKTRILEGASLSEAAAESGFADQSHMTRTFVTATGMTPTAFRRAFGVRLA
jgi:AraC family transcriptional regulator